jgi:GDPmannose 4,6-dehydratase
MIANNVLIIGVNGQDGLLLSNELARTNGRLLGIGKESVKSPHLPNSLEYHSIDIRNSEKIRELVEAREVSQVYNLAGFSSVAKSLLEPEKTMEINYYAVRSLLAELYGSEKNRNLKFFQCSSSEMFGSLEGDFHDEESRLNPKSPYAISKALAHLECQRFRGLGFFVTCGILFNHESIFRPVTYLSRKVTSGLARIKLGQQEKIIVGNLEVVRDWGSAEDYVRAMVSMMNTRNPSDFVIATGIGHTVKQLIELALEESGLEGDFARYIQSDLSLNRPNELSATIGNPGKIAQQLGWSHSKNLRQILSEMFQFDLDYHRANN